MSGARWRDTDLNKRERFECTRGHVLNGHKALASLVALKNSPICGVLYYTILCRIRNTPHLVAVKNDAKVFQFGTWIISNGQTDNWGSSVHLRGSNGFQNETELLKMGKSVFQRMGHWHSFLYQEYLKNQVASSYMCWGQSTSLLEALLGLLLNFEP